MHPDILKLHAAIERDHWWFAARRAILRDLSTAVQPPGEHIRLLDLGCGTGGNMIAFRDLYSCVGVELDAEAVAFARDTHPECRFTAGSVYEPKSWRLEGPVDVCLVLDVLEHLDDDESAVRNAMEVVRPGGHLIVTVPAEPALWSRHDEHHEHRRRYTTASLAELVDHSDFDRRLLSPFNSRLYPLIRSWRWLQTMSAFMENRGTTGDLRMPPRVVNRLLYEIFVGERRQLLAALDAPSAAYRSGVSLIALLRRRGSST